ncbi:ArsR/SmtB family transcription factor [Streptomyces yokosukanensis]|uniref:ArsR/SmtB family transcription factor n=1 Tax=Streptomyces yokosukanensis TaxID=67386 RepID=UPI00082DB9D1|nr:metalloregulator ArsR/SmtB family transcription factor [Streptomyces yokosukanensis]
MRRYFHPETDDILLPAVLFALSDATRLGIALALADGEERTAGELGDGMAKSTMTHHLKILREAGVLYVRSEGTRCYNSLRLADLESRYPGLLDHLLGAAAQDGYSAPGARRPEGDAAAGAGGRSARPAAGQVRAHRSTTTS